MVERPNQAFDTIFDTVPGRAHLDRAIDGRLAERSDCRIEQQLIERLEVQLDRPAPDVSPGGNIVH